MGLQVSVYYMTVLDQTFYVDAPGILVILTNGRLFSAYRPIRDLVVRFASA